MTVPPPGFQNQASDDAHVEQQIGAIYGGTFHRHETTYNINPRIRPSGGSRSR
ncbi:hypothetical protein [Amycolatopsis plumensis]|uniref:Uncharacterized protein n=1 Tax=Amycolatopsis plumensis TaxID=236508 RepID=A0ABV5UHD8_9PSEU